MKTALSRHASLRVPRRHFINRARMPQSPWATRTWSARPCARWAFTGLSRGTTTRMPRSPWNTARRDRRAGSTGAPLFRVERRAHLAEKYGSRLEVPDDGWLFAGSVLLLEPGTAYELRLTLKDPDGGSATRSLKSRTRSEPRVSPRARRRYVVPGSGGGTGTERDPFRGLEAAQKAAAPGDLFLLGPGSLRRNLDDSSERHSRPADRLARSRPRRGHHRRSGTRRCASRPGDRRVRQPRRLVREPHDPQRHLWCGVS